MLNILLIVLLVLIIAGALPVYGKWGAPGGVVTILILILLVALLTGHL